MTDDLLLNIGGVTICVRNDVLDDEPRRLRTYNAYQTDENKQPDIFLRSHRRSFSQPGGEKIFECLPIWALHYYQGDRIIDLFPEMPRLRRSLVISPDLKQVDLYINEDAHGFCDPLYGPTMELLMMNYLATGKGVMVHACGIAGKDKGILFVGESGAGKSTIARLWEKEELVDILSDDRVIVRKDEQGFWIHGTPWHGEAAFASPRRVKLEEIFFIRHSKRNAIRRINESNSVSRFLTSSFPPLWDSQGMAFTLEFLDELAAKSPCYELGFMPDKSIVEFIQNIART